MAITTELRKFVAPEIITGIDARLMVGRYIEHFASKRPLIVTDQNIEKLSWFQDILAEFAAYQIDPLVYREVTSNPRDYEVMKGAQIFLEHKCDLIIAVGGGSPIDCAKGISIVSSNGGHILDYEGVDEIRFPGPPLIAIPTTAGASADVSQFAIVCDTESHVKKAIISKKVVPDLALIDPIPLMTMDLYLTACTGMDAMVHAIEAYTSNANSHLTDVHAKESIKLIFENMKGAISPNRNVESMYKMMLGSLHAGLAFSNASLGAVHAMAHSLGGMLDLPHGECNSILLEHVIELNFESATDKYTEIAKIIGIRIDDMDPETVKISLIHKLKEFRETIGIGGYATVDELDSEMLEKLTQGALRDPCIVTNPRMLTPEEVTKVYGQILRQKK